MQKNKGYTFIEILLVIGIIGILSTVLMVVINPKQQIDRAQDAQRETDLVAIVSTIQQFAAENSGTLPDTDGDEETSNFPTTATCIGTDVSCFDLASAGDDEESIVPNFVVSLPMDPDTGTLENTGYTIYVDENGHLHASATPETKPSIEVSR